MKKKFNKPIPFAMIGGGDYSLIGSTHRLAMKQAGIELVGGVFSSKVNSSMAFGKSLGLKRDRVHGTMEELLQSELERPPSERIAGVVIVTPNHLHYSAAKAFIKAGFHVVIDKPLVHTYKQAQALWQLHKQKNLSKNKHQVVMVTYSYTGYPMVKLARKIIEGKSIGDIRKVEVEYAQGWLAHRIEKQGIKKAIWRTEHRTSGLAGTVADIGTHAENLVSYVTGLKIQALTAQLSTLVKGRKIDDDGNILVNYLGGAVGVMKTSQVLVGEDNYLALKVYGEKGSVKWNLTTPDSLSVFTSSKGEVVYQGYRVHQMLKGVQFSFKDYQQTLAKIKILLKQKSSEFKNVSLEKTHNLLAFSNIYNEAAKHIRSTKSKELYDYPNLLAGVRGMQFIEKAVHSSRKKKWIKFS